jgi:prepilin-type N-terminal cleavage/methylation domain-containing protein
VTSLGTDEGFTLLEVLTAIMIAAVVFSTLFASYGITLKTIEGSEALSVIYESARVGLERMIEDLEGAYAPALKEGVSKAQALADEAFVGEEIIEEGRRTDKISFFSITASCLDASTCMPAPARISYEARKEGEAFTLYRGEAPLLGRRQVGMLPLIKGLYSVEFSYRDDAGRVSRSWDSPTPPALVTINLTFRHRVEEDVVFFASAAIPTARYRNEKPPKQ